MRLTVATQKVLQAQHVRIIDRSDNDRAARSAFEQADTAQNQGAHDALAEVCLLHHQVAQSIGGNDQRVDRLARLNVNKGGASRKLREFARELSRTMGDDRLRPVEPTALNDVE